LLKIGVNSYKFKADASNYKAMEEVIDDYMNRVKKIDCLVCNAGISTYGTITDMSVEEIQTTIETNIYSVIYTCKLIAPYMISQKYGSIVNMSSMWGMVGASCESIYSASKGAIIAFSKSLAKELGPSNIRVNVVAPGVVMTDMMKTVLMSGTGTNAAISGVYQAGKTGTSNYSDNELNKLTKNSSYSSIVAPDELFVGYTPEYSMAVWTGYSNRLTPVLDNGMQVATDVYRQMMLYLANNNNSGHTDWTQPSGLYRNGSYLYLNNGKNNYNNYYYEPSYSTEESSTEESSSSSSSEENPSKPTETSSQDSNNHNE